VSRAAIEIITIAIVAGIYLFLFWVVRSLRGHLDAEPEQPTPLRRLQLHDENGTPTRAVAIAGSIVIGRSAQAEVVIDDSFASEFHARIGPTGAGTLRVLDLGSTNGTFVNGERITSPTPLGIGDQIRIGQTIMEVR
jgi:pSer/pThr/pTyr-binding forkhead associated (FHA) protein